MSDGQILKPDKDFSKEVDRQLPEAEQLAKVYQHDSWKAEM
jgi:26S proteasome regulatory subunit N5